MAKRFGKTKKDPFSALSEEFKDAMAAAGPDELHKRLSSLSKNESLNLAAMSADQDLKSARAAVTVANQGYKEATKSNKLMTKYITQQLADRGDAVSSETIRLNLVAAQ